ADWRLAIGIADWDWRLGIGPIGDAPIGEPGPNPQFSVFNPQSPIQSAIVNPNPQSSICQSVNLQSAVANRRGSGRFTNLETRESADRDVLAQDADGVLHQLRDRGVGIADRRLLHEAELLVEAVQLSLDDLVDDLGRLVLDLIPIDLLL